jgi:hypothetical protein
VSLIDVNPHLFLQPAKVTAHTVAVGSGMPDKTVFLIKFTPEVMAREKSFA